MSLAVLSYGGGQDSTALLLMYINDPDFRRKYASEDFVVVHAATGNEHVQTDRHVQYTKTLCQQHGIEFHHLTPDRGFHSDKWPDLLSFYRRTKTCGSKAFNKTCTDRLKLQPIYRWLSDWVSRKYGMPTFGHPFKSKTPLVEYARLYGKITMIIGIAGDETKRAVGNWEGEPKWQQLSVTKAYPLIDSNMNRQACQDYIRSVGEEVPLPSNCMVCPFMSEQELLWLYYFERQMYDEWVVIERIKLEANAHLGDRNLGVWGRKTLPEVLERALKRYGHMTPAQLNEYKMSHGHCLMSKY